MLCAFEVSARGRTRVIAGAFVVIADTDFALTGRDILIVGGFDTLGFVFVIPPCNTVFAGIRTGMRTSESN